MSQKIKDYIDGAVKYPYILHNFAVDGLLTGSKSLAVESATLPWPELHTQKVWYQGICSEYPTGQTSSGVWSCTIADDANLNVLANLCYTWANNGSLQFPGYYRANNKGTITIKLHSHFNVVLRGARLKTISPLNLATNDPTAVVKWNVTFAYDRAEPTLPMSEEAVVVQESLVQKRPGLDLQVYPTFDEVSLNVSDKALARQLTVLINGSVISLEDADALAKAVKENWLQKALKAIKDAKKKVDKVNDKIQSEIGKVKKTVRTVKSIKSEVDSIGRQFTKEGDYVASYNKVKKQFKKLKDSKFSLKQLLNTADTLASAASSTTQTTANIAGSANNIAQKTGKIVNPIVDKMSHKGEKVKAALDNINGKVRETNKENKAKNKAKKTEIAERKKISKQSNRKGRR
nr:MAG TPA: baseplate wedge protein [Bacteriophage sp.]